MKLLRAFLAAKALGLASDLKNDCNFSWDKHPTDRILDHLISIEWWPCRSTGQLGIAIGALQEHE